MAKSNTPSQPKKKADDKKTAPVAVGSLIKAHEGRVNENTKVMASLETAIKDITAIKNPTRTLRFAASRIREAMQMLGRATKGHSEAVAKLKVRQPAPAAKEKEESPE